MQQTDAVNECKKHEHPKECSVRLMFLGSPLLDVTAECGPDILRKYGLKPDDCVRATTEHDGLFRELFEDPRSRWDAGGSALNSAKIAKWTVGDEGNVAFAGCVGNDEYATRLESELASSGVEPLFVTLQEHPTGVCACLLSPDARQRSLCTRHGASARFAKRHLVEEPDIREWLRESRCVFVVGYFVAHSPDVVRALAEMMAPDQLFSLSLSAEYICRDFKDPLLTVLPRVDILFGNEAEIRAFARALELHDPGESIESAACAIAALDRKSGDLPRIVVVSRGPNPVLLVRGGEQRPIRHPVPPDVPVVDSVGCGDALAGAFLGIYALTGKADEAVRAGIRAAVEIAQVPGCNPPPLEDTELGCVAGNGHH